jgi:hypothetical protein
MRQPICSTLLVLLCLSVASGQDLQDDKDTARALWEQAVAAMGGRQRLSAIESFAIHKRTAFSRLTLRDMATGVVFDLDAKTHLPIRIETTRKNPLPPPRPGMAPPGGTRFVYELERYSEVGGIQVPGRVRLGGDASDVRVEINPDYEPSIFSTPPSPDATTEAWRKKDG